MPTKEFAGQTSDADPKSAEKRTIIITRDLKSIANLCENVLIYKKYAL